MTACADLRVLFRAPAGARRGFGHLVRCRSFARALGVRPLIAVRGSQRAVDAALLLGCDVVAGTAAQVLGRLRPDVLVVDDPIPADAKRWIEAARRVGCAVVSVHDLGLGCHDSDLAIDGSIVLKGATLARARRGVSPGRLLAGAEFAILDPTVARRTHSASSQRVLIALGGGPRVALARAIADAIAAAQPAARIRIAAGFVASAPPQAAASSTTWVAARSGLAAELASADVAIVGGGVSLYEAAAAGAAAVGVPVVRAQSPTVAAFAAMGAARAARGAATPAAIAEQAVLLLRDPDMSRRVAAIGRRLVDGQGALRAAAAVTQLVAGR